MLRFSKILAALLAVAMVVTCGTLPAYSATPASGTGAAVRATDRPGGTVRGEFGALPTDGSDIGLYMVTDCADAACAAGGGTTWVLKYWNGAGWSNQASAGGDNLGTHVATQPITSQSSPTSDALMQLESGGSVVIRLDADGDSLSNPVPSLSGTTVPHFVIEGGDGSSVFYVDPSTGRVSMGRDDINTVVLVSGNVEIDGDDPSEGGSIYATLTMGDSSGGGNVGVLNILDWRQTVPEQPGAYPGVGLSPNTDLTDPSRRVWTLEFPPSSGAAGQVLTSDGVGPAPGRTRSSWSTVVRSIEDEGTPRTSRPVLNFVGAGVTCTDDAGNSETDCSIPGQMTVEDEGVARTSRPVINFVGAGVSCVDDAAGNETDCTIPGAGAGSVVDSKDVVWKNPTSSDDVRIKTEATLNLTNYDCVAWGGSIGTMLVTMGHCDAAGAGCTDIQTAILTALDTPYTSTPGTPIPSDRYVRFDVNVAIAPAPDYLSCSLRYTK